MTVLKAPFTDEELERLYAGCDKIGPRLKLGPGYRTWGDDDVKDFIYLSTYTGLRISDTATFDVARRLEGKTRRVAAVLQYSSGYVKLCRATTTLFLVPGLTGWAQANRRDEIPIPLKVQFDFEYLRRRTFVIDLHVIMITAIRDKGYARRGRPAVKVAKYFIPSSTTLNDINFPAVKRIGKFTKSPQ